MKCNLEEYLKQNPGREIALNTEECWSWTSKSHILFYNIVIELESPLWFCNCIDQRLKHAHSLGILGLGLGYSYSEQHGSVSSLV